MNTMMLTHLYGSLHTTWLTKLRWQHEVLHRSVLLNYGPRLEAYRSQRDHMQEEFIEEAEQASKGTDQDKLQCMTKCFHEARKVEEKWLLDVQKVPVSSVSLIYAFTMHSKLKVVKMDKILPQYKAALNHQITKITLLALLIACPIAVLLYTLGQS